MTPTADLVPRFSPDEACSLLREHYGLAGAVESLPSYEDQNLCLRTTDGDVWVLKIANGGQNPATLDAITDALEHLAAHLEDDGLVPRLRRTVSGARLAAAPSATGHQHLLHLVRYLPGVPLGSLPWSRTGANTRPLLESVGRLVARVDAGLEGFTHPALRRDFVWDLRHAPRLLDETHRIQPARRRLLAQRYLERFARSVVPKLETLPSALIHGDANEQNVLVVDDNAPRACGLIDFGDLAYTCRVFSPAIAAAYATLGHPQPLASMAAVVAGYHRLRPLGREELEVLFPALCARLAVSATMSIISRQTRPDNRYANVSEQSAWQAMERLAGVDPALAHEHVERACQGKKAQGLRPSVRADELLTRRRQRLGPSLSLAYRQPLNMVRGWMQYLFDPVGRPYLDCVNNVCHVGHCHPQVVDAIAQQAARLNTNSRYLHEKRVAYAERLCATLPPSLQVCYFVCSGSEANDLALRLARSHTGRQGVIAIEGAYHGHTGCLIDVSPYKHRGPGGLGTPPHVRVVPMPDAYRLRVDGHDPAAGRKRALPVAQAARDLASTPHGVSALIVESLFGCGGQVVPVAGYLEQAFAHARAAGAVCILDEVQVGFGRVGTHFWAFEAQGVVPDIVTMGKPIGNGHPLAAVVTTPEIAASFANGMEYFNTFGGNPVSCAAGLAVLDVLENEGLQAHALACGRRLRDGLEDLAERHPLIGDVRGQGLFLGIELVLDRMSLEPAPDQASELVERMRERGILLSADGPLHNVIKINPPLPFAAENADQVVEALDAVFKMGLDRRDPPVHGHHVR